MARTKPRRVSNSQRLQRVLSAKQSGTHPSSISSASPVKPEVRTEEEGRPIVIIDLDTTEELLEELSEISSQNSENQAGNKFTGNGADSNSDDSSEASDQEDSPAEPNIDDQNPSKMTNYKARDGTIKKRYRPGNKNVCFNIFETFFWSKLFIAGVKALKEIRYFQNQCSNTIPHAPFGRLIREILAEISPTHYKLTVQTLMALQVSLSTSTLTNIWEKYSRPYRKELKCSSSESSRILICAPSTVGVSQSWHGTWN